MKNLKLVDIEKMSFEEAFNELNKIVDFIESTDVSLDDSIMVYETGIQLKKHCENTWEITQITFNFFNFFKFF